MRAEEPFQCTNRRPQRVTGRRHGRGACLAEGLTSTEEVSFPVQKRVASAVRTRFFVTVPARARAARLAGCEQPSPRGVNDYCTEGLHQLRALHDKLRAAERRPSREVEIDRGLGGWREGMVRRCVVDFDRCTYTATDVMRVKLG